MQPQPANFGREPAFSSTQGFTAASATGHPAVQSGMQQQQQQQQQPHSFQQQQQPAVQQQQQMTQQQAAQLQQQQLISDLVTGLVTSGIYTSLTYPIHRVKILLQTQDANPRIVSGKVPRYSFVHSFGRLVREQGLLGLWRGNTPYLLRHVPSISMSFAFKDAFREALPRYDASQHPFAALAANAAAGAAAGALSLALVYPFEFATVRMAADLGTGAADRQYGTGMMSAWLQAMRADGPLSCYRGFSVAVTSMAAYKALYFGLYDTAKSILLPEDGRHLELTAQAVISRTALAAATTFLAASLTYPLDIIRKRLIVDVGSERRLYHGSFKAAVQRIYAREGLKGFYRFYSYDMVFRLGGGLLLVGYDLLRSHGTKSREAAAAKTAAAAPAGAVPALVPAVAPDAAASAAAAAAVGGMSAAAVSPEPVGQALADVAAAAAAAATAAATAAAGVDAGLVADGTEMTATVRQDD